MPRRVRALVVLAIALVAVPAPAGAAGARGLSLGFLDPLFTAGADVRGPWLGRAVDSGADIVRMQIGWPVADSAEPSRRLRRAQPRRSGIRLRSRRRRGHRRARARPARAALVHGRAALGRGTAPPGRRRPRQLEAGSRRGRRLRRGARQALLRNRSPTLRAPAAPCRAWTPFRSGTSRTSTPTSPRSGARGKPFAPAHYRRMLNAFYAGVKSVQPAALVVTAGTAPFGDEQVNGKRIMPVRFVRDMLCLRESAGRLRTRRAARARHASTSSRTTRTPTGFPRRRSLNPDDASIPDFGKLTRLVRAAERTGRALPDKRHRFWVDGGGATTPRRPIPTASRACATPATSRRAFYLLWKQGVDTITWLRVVDEAPMPSYAATNQSGVYFLDGRAKRAQRAFRFPFVAERAGRGTLRVWGRAPIAGTVRIERRTASGWRLVRTTRVGSHATFLVRISARGKTTLRARVGTETSLAWVAR